MPEKHSLIRTIYLYLFALVGLALLIAGTVRFIDMGLKVYVFTKADDPERISRQRYYYSGPITIEKIEGYQDSEELTEEEKATLKSLLADYKEWEERESQIDYLTSERQEEASSNLAMIIIGLPLYLYHWRIIRRETPKETLRDPTEQAKEKEA
jgi:hypothetical protein